MSNLNFPTEELDLPSKGLVYPKDNPLSSGKVEIKYMTAREEDILSNRSYIEKGIVLDKLLESVIISPINIKDLVVGDKNAILIATRIMGYGKKFNINYRGQEQTIDLTKLENKPFDESYLSTVGENKFEYTLPHSEIKITFQISTGHLEQKIERELNGLRKIHKESVPEITTRLKHIITSVEGSEDPKNIREFVDNMLARDAREFRKHLRDIQPDVDLNYILEDGKEVEVPIGPSFFWPDI